MKLYTGPGVGEHNKAVFRSERRVQVTKPHEIEQSLFEPVRAIMQDEG
jgi:hypothetical protein